MSLFPGADIPAVFNNTEKQEKVQVNEDKGEDKPGGCHSSQVRIFRLYLIIRIVGADFSALFDNTEEVGDRAGQRGQGLR